MTTPAQSVNTSAAAAYERKRLPNSIEASGVGEVARFSRYRPVSVNNVERPDGTRKPSDWTSSGGYGRGAVTPTPLRFSRTGVSYDITGLLARPPTQMGAISSPVDLAIMRSYAIRDALGHYADAEQRLGVATREVKETADLVTKYYQGAAKGLGELSRDVQRGSSKDGGALARQLKKGLTGWKQVPARYLEYLYGMRPLADEIDNAVEVLTQSRDRGASFRLTLRGRYEKRMQSVMMTPATAPPNATIYQARVDTTVAYEARASLVFVLPSWFWDRLPPVTPFSEQFEVTTLSFVLDWVLPVSNWLRGFEGLQLRPFFKEGSTTTFLRRSAASCRITGIPPYGGLYDFPYTIRDYSMQRLAFDTFPTEQVMKLPRLRNTLGISKMDQAAALAGQRLTTLGRTLNRYY